MIHENLSHSLILRTIVSAYNILFHHMHVTSLTCQNYMILFLIFNFFEEDSKSLEQDTNDESVSKKVHL